MFTIRTVLFAISCFLLACVVMPTPETPAAAPFNCWILCRNLAPMTPTFQGNPYDLPANDKDSPLVVVFAEPFGKEMYVSGAVFHGNQTEYKGEFVTMYKVTGCKRNCGKYFDVAMKKLMDDPDPNYGVGSHICNDILHAGWLWHNCRFIGDRYNGL